MRPDQLSPGVAGLQGAPHHPLPPLVDVAGGDSRDPEQAGIADGYGAMAVTVVMLRSAAALPLPMRSVPWQHLSAVPPVPDGSGPSAAGSPAPCTRSSG